MAKNSQFWKIQFLNFGQNVEFFYTKTPSEMAENSLNWAKTAKMSFVLIFEKKIFEKFLKNFVIFIAIPYLKQAKMGLIDLISQFWPNSSTLDKLDFSLIWPYMSSNLAKTASNGLIFGFLTEKKFIQTTHLILKQGTNR